MPSVKLYMILLGCKPAGRRTEQHDIYIGIGESLASLKPAMNSFWPAVKNKLHIDAYREVNFVEGFEVRIVEKTAPTLENEDSSMHLHFLNLGGYREGEFNEFHYKMIVAAKDLDEAKKMAKKDAFFKHYRLAPGPLNHGADAHIDDKYGIDVDDAYPISEILDNSSKLNYRIALIPSTSDRMDDTHLGYIRFAELG